MKLLLNDKFAPITSEIGFIEAEIGDVVSEYIKWMQPICLRRGILLKQEQVSGELSELLGRLLPLTDHDAMRYLFIPTLKKWTAYFDNNWRGTDSSSTISVLAERLKCRSIRIAAIPDTITADENRGRYGATVLELYGATKTNWLNMIRSISAIHDGDRWAFDNFGQPFNFETIERYSEKRARDRFDLDMLAYYLHTFGIEAFNANFYDTKRNSILISKFGSSYPTPV